MTVLIQLVDHMECVLILQVSTVFYVIAVKDILVFPVQCQTVCATKVHIYCFYLFLVVATRLNVVKIVKSPVNTNANLYELVSLTCMVTGDQPIVYQWERDGNILPNRKLSYLIIPEVNPEDRGVYRCLVNNSISSAISQPGLLTIKGKLS